MKVRFAKPWAYSPNGAVVVHVEPGEHDLPDHLVPVAEACGVLEKAKPAPRNKAKAAPRNKGD